MWADVRQCDRCSHNRANIVGSGNPKNIVVYACDVDSTSRYAIKLLPFFHCQNSLILANFDLFKQKVWLFILLF